MADPTIDETRGDARVVVYGDAAPVTELEWYCARLVWALYAGAPLEIYRRTLRPTYVAAGAARALPLVYRATRGAATRALGAVLARLARRDADHLEREARKLRQSGAIADADQYQARAARLRAILAGAP